MFVPKMFGVGTLVNYRRFYRYILLSVIVSTRIFCVPKINKKSLVYIYVYMYFIDLTQFNLEYLFFLLSYNSFCSRPPDKALFTAYYLHRL